MTRVAVSRRVVLKSSKAALAVLVFSPAIIGRAEAASLKLKCSSSLPNDPKFANGRVYFDNLVKSLKANGLLPGLTGLSGMSSRQRSQPARAR